MFDVIKDQQDSLVHPLCAHIRRRPLCLIPNKDTGVAEAAKLEALYPKLARVPRFKDDEDWLLYQPFSLAGFWQEYRSRIEKSGLEKPTASNPFPLTKQLRDALPPRKIIRTFFSEMDH